MKDWCLPITDHINTPWDVDKLFFVHGFPRLADCFRASGGSQKVRKAINMQVSKPPALTLEFSSLQLYCPRALDVCGILKCCTVHCRDSKELVQQELEKVMNERDSLAAQLRGDTEKWTKILSEARSQCKNFTKCRQESN